MGVWGFDCKEVGIRVPFFLWSILVGEPSPKKGWEGALLGNLANSHSHTVGSVKTNPGLVPLKETTPVGSHQFTRWTVSLGVLQIGHGVDLVNHRMGVVSFKGTRFLVRFHALYFAGTSKFSWE